MIDPLKKPLYGNCVIVSPDNQILCRTNQKKIDWYIERNLADYVEGTEIPTIRLRFEPSGRKRANHPYTSAKKENICVCCGSNQNLTRHHVVPYSFRKFFPLEIKDHAVHDVLLLCINCHEKYESIATDFKKKLSNDYNIPLSGKGCSIIESAYSVAAAGHALINFRDKIPKDRQKILEDRLRVFFKKDEITEEDCRFASEVKPIVKNKDFVPFGKYIIEQFPDIMEFIVMWRTHFVENMKPQHLPDFWSVDNEL